MSDNEDMLAEIVALNQAATRALLGLASLAGDSGARDQYVAVLLESGLRDLGRTRFPGVDPARQERLIEKARARYTSSCR